MRGVRLTVEVGPAGELEQVLTLNYDDLLEAALLNSVPIQWTWHVHGVEMRMTARRDDTEDTPEPTGLTKPAATPMVAPGRLTSDPSE